MELSNKIKDLKLRTRCSIWFLTHAYTNVLSLSLKDRLPDRHLRLNLYPWVIKFSLSVSHQNSYDNCTHPLSLFMLSGSHIPISISLFSLSLPPPPTNLMLHMVEQHPHVHLHCPPLLPHCCCPPGQQVLMQSPRRKSRKKIEVSYIEFYRSKIHKRLNECFVIGWNMTNVQIFQDFFPERWQSTLFQFFWNFIFS